MGMSEKIDIPSRSGPSKQKLEARIQDETDDVRATFWDETVRTIYFFE